MEIELQPCEKWKMLMKILSFNLTTFHYACFSFTFPIRILPEAKFSTLSGFTAFISSPPRPFPEYSAILNVIKYSCYSSPLLKGDFAVLNIVSHLSFEKKMETQLPDKIRKKQESTDCRGVLFNLPPLIYEATSAQMFFFCRKPSSRTLSKSLKTNNFESIQM